MKKPIYAILLVLVIVAAYMLGRSHTKQVAASTSRRVLYYVDPMHPAYKSDKPGIAPDCGMQLEPVYAGDASDTSQSAMVTQLPAGTVSIAGAAQQQLGIRTAAVENSGGSRSVRVVGRVASEDTRVYRINSGIDGFIRETFNDSVGSLVKKDQRLAGYYGPDFLAVASGFLAASEHVPGSENKDAARTMPFPGTVSKQGFSSISGYADRLRNLGMSDAQMKQIADSRKLPASIDIVSPVDGFILARNITSGQHFDRSMEFYRIADLRQVWIVAEIFENEAQYFRPGAIARVSLPGQQKTFRARISNVLPEVDPTTRTLKLRLEADNPGYALRPEMFVDVELPVTVPPGLTIPADALLDSGLRQQVFVDRGDGFFEPRSVKTGWRFGDRVQITEGLKEGERVVSSGTFLVDSESRLRANAAQVSEAPAHESHGVMPVVHRAEAKAKMATDPVCGMQVDRAAAVKAGNTISHDGMTMYFCSKDCKQKFEQGGEKHIAANHHGAGHD
jgi:RND family efflux transporter MFP subunit